jgi:protein tyrosine/serine phosphatase
VGKKKKQSLAALYIILVVIAAIILLVRHFHIKNFHIVEPEVLYTSGQPRGMDYTRLLYKYHIATIINLRSPAEHRERNWYAEEITWVHSNGVKYFEMPLNKNINSPNHFPDANMQEQLLAIMTDKEKLPVLIHDSSGKSRAAMLAAVWLAKGQKLSIEQVLAVAKQIKKEPLTEPQTRFIRSLSKPGFPILK